jgi:endonuclease/exonuclease/phosphatase family metal-dependent hydrolase
MRSVTLGFMLIAALASAQNIKVMTYNIRLDTPADGINAWPNRIEKVAHLIQHYSPDIIGVQEAFHHQITDLIRILPEYSWMGVGRDDGKEKGEYSAILYKHARFGLLAGNTFWLSEKPEVPGSKHWDAAITRIATWARLYDKELHAEFFLLNTHFDHVGVSARTKSAALIKAQLPELAQGNPIIITGDFNCTAKEDAYSVMVNQEEPVLFDASKGKHTGTFCGFQVDAIPCVHIDYIFHSAEWKVWYQRVFEMNDGKHYPSDHLPVLAELELIRQK